MAIQTNCDLEVGKHVLMVEISRVFEVSRRRPYMLVSILVIRIFLVNFISDFNTNALKYSY